MLTLIEVAADVAAALGLKHQNDAVGDWYRTDSTGYHAIHKDGSNLTDPYWRCACEDWLYARNTSFTYDPHAEHASCYEWIGLRIVSSELVGGCIAVEAPARLVSAVWRRMQSEAKP